MILYNFIKCLVLSIRYNNLLNRIYREERLLEGLTLMFGSEVKQDWIGRIYVVINPHIKNGKWDPESMVQELGNDEVSRAVAMNMIMGTLTTVQQFIKANNLFDLLTYEIRQISNNDDYLLIMEPITYPDLKNYGKKFLMTYGVLLLLIILFLIY